MWSDLPRQRIFINISSFFFFFFCFFLLDAGVWLLAACRPVATEAAAAVRGGGGGACRRCSARFTGHTTLPPPRTKSTTSLAFPLAQPHASEGLKRMLQRRYAQHMYLYFGTMVTIRNKTIVE
jgi:hypothetical protein